MYGDGVNVAARLESIADPGGIYVSESIEKAIRGQADLQAKFLGEIKLKNVDYDVRAYAVQGIGLPVPEVNEGKELSGHFFAEIQRRGVIRAGVTYVALSLLLLLLTPHIGTLVNFPDWTPRALIACLITGFLIAVYLAWNYERGPEGFIKTDTKMSWRNPYSLSRRKPLTSNVFVAIVLIGSALVFFFSSKGVSTGSNKDQLKDVKKLHMLFPESAPVALANETPRIFGRKAIDLSPNGKVFAYIGWQNDRSLLCLRYLEDNRVVPVKGTEDAFFPVFSPDSKWIAFVVGGELRKLMVPQGKPQFVSSTPAGPRGIVWAKDKNIYYATNTALWKISEYGSDPDSLTSLEGLSNRIVSSASQIDISPDQKHIIMSDFSGDIYAYSLETGKRQIIFPNGGGSPFFTPSGHLLFSRNESLYGVAFDLEELHPLGNENLIISSVQTESTGPQLAFSGDGMAIYIEGDYYQKLQFTYVDKNGNAEHIKLATDSYGSFDLSPNGQLLAVGMLPAQDHISVHELETGRIIKIIVPGTQTLYSPVWGPDNESIIFSANFDGEWFFYHKNIYVVGDPVKIEVDLFNINFNQWPYSWSENGDYVCIGNAIVRLNEDRTKGNVESVISTAHAEVSPNGQYVVYSSSTESGQEEVNLQPLPISGKKWQISIDGGTDPIWSKDGKIVFYHNSEAIYSVEIDSTKPSQVNFKTPEVFYSGPYRNLIMRSIAVSPDGNRMLILKPIKGELMTREAIVTINWFDELKRLAPIGN